MLDPDIAPSLPFSELEPEAPRYGIADLCAELAGYLPADEVREVYRAYLVGAEAHQDQKRKSGLPYISHPVAVARILGKMHMDSRCLMAAMLHDVLEDTAMPKSQIAEAFGGEVAELVDGVTKLTQINFQNKLEAQAENFRKMMLAMTKDIRVILIKLADRLHNMHTLGAMKREAQRRIACETLDIYAPIANRLGINKIRLDLEELGFEYAWPMRFRALMNAVRTVHQNHRELIDNVETVLRGRLEQEGLNGRVQGREKHLYSIYRKMREKHVAFSEVVDVFAFRIIVDRVDACYRVLGAVHNLYKPKPGGFKDYIAIPKSNGYQSLHTVLVGPQGIPVEIQIRTREMDWMAEFGVASHWFYKEGKPDGSPIQKYANDWVRNLLELQKGAGNSIEFLEHVKVDLFPDEVYVFTPRGEIKVLAKGATVIDFAYGVHSDVGNYCVAALVDRRWVPLRTRIHSGQTVEIITKEGGRPDPPGSISWPPPRRGRTFAPSSRGCSSRRRWCWVSACWAAPWSPGTLPGDPGAGTPGAGAQGLQVERPGRVAGTDRPGQPHARPGGQAVRRVRRRPADGGDPPGDPRHRGDGGEALQVLPPHPRRRDQRLLPARPGGGGASPGVPQRARCPATG
jgi:GTP diphosphokinase / guanosine-3',5'-bis(diphosphate) 3'-diphosphatase